MSTLTLQNVSYKYEGSERLVIRDVSMSFEPGKVYTIIGKSGAGKSTLLNLLAGLDVATTGHIVYDGVRLAEINRNHYRARKAGIIFQGFNLLTNATALDNILLSMHISGVKGINKKARALELLEKVGISPEKANRKILKLSGGEQQRIGMARALAHNPELIVADEPTGNLDEDTANRVLGVFASLAHEEGKCVIIVTHSKEVIAIADEIWSVDEGVFRPVPVNEG
ncbi:putative ABC transport system ATP-binding protein [Sporobacter termitidis DSM 10068]|uniref:Putative ABC transport system ATP-binding protein n=1 Tax=Sporobacter termitidis DSM 10068 TaxID=1123282 RepID=A0A1M5Z3P8_9FIRM|nr:ABC transporter ATP-binding protein [Sporobacter termitidis]SHI18865.1 putative ABC transport system ATP-binding protein [Sporobacter termitidis DSM 10068]